MPIPSLDSFVVKRIAVDASTNGSNTIVSASIGKIIYVISFFMISAGTVNATFQDGAGGPELTGPVPLIANTGVSCPFNIAGWFTTSPGNLLNLLLSSGVQVSGVLDYILVS